MLEQGQDEKMRSLMEHEQRFLEKRKKAEQIRLKHQQVAYHTD